MARFRFRHLFALLAVAATVSLVVAEADARVSRGGSSGSRGARTYTAPPPTATAPSTAQPLQRTVTQPNAAARPSTPAASPAPGLAGRPGGMFGGGLLGGLAAGFIGAGLFGMLFGHGLGGGLGGFASFIGLLLQVGLVIIVARLAWSWWQRRQQPQPAMASGPSMRDNAMGSNNATGSGGGFGSMFGLGGGAAAATAPAGVPLDIDGGDFDQFEELLTDIQKAYSDENLNALRPLTTPEMLSYFSEDLADNASRGVINKVSDVKLLQGDLSEAWREDDTDYATVAMRFGLTDQTLDRVSGQLVEGSTAAMEATELWTFRRVPRGNWVLAGIQQVES